MNSPTFALHALIVKKCHPLMFNLKYITKYSLKVNKSIYIWKAESIRNLSGCITSYYMG